MLYLQLLHNVTFKTALSVQKYVQIYISRCGIYFKKGDLSRSVNMNLALLGEKISDMDNREKAYLEKDKAVSALIAEILKDQGKIENDIKL